MLLVDYSTPEACKVSGATYRQVDYWDRQGLLSPSQPARGSGTYRRYSLDEVLALGLLAAVCPMLAKAPTGALGAALSKKRHVAVVWTRGEPTPRFVAASRLSAVVGDGPALILDTKDVRARIAGRAEVLAVV